MVIIIPNKALSFVNKVKEDCRKSADSHYKSADTLSDTQLRKIENLSGTMMRNFEIIYGMIQYTLQSVNVADSLINELAKRSANEKELLKLRAELIGKINETLKPIKDEIEGGKALKKRRSNAGIQ